MVNTVSAVLLQQVRQIGIMKAIGAQVTNLRRDILVLVPQGDHQDDAVRSAIIPSFHSNLVFASNRFSGALGMTENKTF